MKKKQTEGWLKKKTMDLDNIMEIVSHVIML